MFLKLPLPFFEGMKTTTFIICFLCIQCNAQQFPHPGSHAHNDYLHDRPLFDALANGFTTIEADVHLINGALVVSHDKPEAGAKTLEQLYLKPLDSLIKSNKGKVYRAYNLPVVLMIDVKTSATETQAALLKVLSVYKNNLYTPSHPGALRIIISGNRDIPAIKGDPEHLTSIDGRPDDIGKGFSNDVMPIISDAYQRIAGEKIEAMPSAQALERIKELAVKVHRENKQLRLWAIPDNEQSWKALRSAGVDIINTDHLEAFHKFTGSEK